MTKITLLSALIALPVTAFAQINLGDTLGTSETAIRAALEAQGYTITEFETEDGQIEVEATAGGQAFEFEVSQETGQVLAAELEDEDDEDDEDEEDDDEKDDDDSDKG